MTTALEKARIAAANARAAGQMQPATDVFQRFDKQNTRKTAIDMFCGHCMGGPDNAGYRADIRDCTSGPGAVSPCPLYRWRPYQ